AKPALPVPQSFAHVVQDHPDRGGARLLDRIALGPEDRVAQKADSMDGHAGQSCGFPDSRQVRIVSSEYDYYSTTRRRRDRREAGWLEPCAGRRSPTWHPQT